MERLTLVMSHASRSMRGGMRDVMFCAALRKRGVDARIWRMHGGETAREEILGVPVTYCPSDDPALIPHHQTSATLRASVAGFRPDVVLYKGLGYRICTETQAALSPRARHGFIVGGSVKDPLLETASIVLAEYAEQLLRHFPVHAEAGRALVLPKHVDLALAGDGAPPDPAEFDIVNVGSFAEKRKNQAALLPFAPWRRIAFVGGGPLLTPAREAAREAKSLHNIRFFGQLEHDAVFGVLRRARIMVHTSLGDGLPRATIEAMACGLPVIAFRDTIQGGIPPEAGLLVSAEALPHAIRLLLTDDGLRKQMGAAGRHHVERNHGEAAIAEAADRALSLLRSQ